MSQIASVYDPIVYDPIFSMILSYPVDPKILCWKDCDLKTPWNEVLQLTIKQKWVKWKLDIETRVEIQR